jgi:hypothetical protein
MASDAILRTYGDSAIREDVVLNAVEILTARETQIFNMLGKTEAIQTIHNYLTDTLRTPSLNGLAVEEAADYTANANSTPSRLTNIVQILALPFKVSRTQQQVAHYTGQNELAWGNAAEFDLVRSVLASGVSGTTPKMAGIIAAISKSTNYTSQTSGTVWSASILDGLVLNNWSNSNGDVATDLFMGGILRKNTDYFTQKSNVVVNSPGISTIVRTVSTYQTAFTTLNIHTHRYVQQSGDATGRVLALRPEKLKVAFLQNGGKPYIDTELARSGDYDVRAVVGKFTLEVHNKDSNFYADGYLLA